MRAFRGALNRFLSLVLSLTFLFSVVFTSVPSARAGTTAVSSPAVFSPQSPGSNAITPPSSDSTPMVLADSPLSRESFTSSSDPLNLASCPATLSAEGKEIKLSASAKEMIAKRTEHSSVFDNGDGTYVLRSYLSRVNYYDEKTKLYQPVDSSLKAATKDSKQIFRNTADAYRLTLPSESGTGEWVSIESSRGAFSYRPSQDASGGVKAKVSSATGSLASSKDSLVYRDAFGSGIDLEYLSNSEGLKETITLSEYTGVTTFGFDLQSLNLTPVLQESGAIWMVSAESTAPVFTIPAPVMEDSLQNDFGEPAFSDKVRYELSETEAGWRLDVIADKAWLSDPKRVYPVRIDPCVIYQDYGTYQANGYTAAMDAFITDAYPNTNYGASYDSGYGYQLKTGYYSGSGNNRSLVMPDVSDIMNWNNNISHLQILGANMNMACYWRYDHGTGPVWYGPITSGWGEGSVTWNTQPGISGYSSANITQGGRTRFDITPIAQAWMDYTLLCAGIAFWGRSGTTGDWTKMYARENGSNYPVFECWFTTSPYTPSVTGHSEGPASGAPYISWSYSDAMGKPQKYARIALWDEALAGDDKWVYSTSNGSATTAALPAPSGGWVDGRIYPLSVQVVGDTTGLGTEVLSQWSDIDYSFTYHAPYPNVATAITAASSGWFTESDTNGDGANDAMNDTNTSGRGSVSLSWEATGSPVGYNIYLHDGYIFRPVGSTTATSWATSGKGLFPTDSAIAAIPSGTTSNPFLSGSGLDLRDDPRPLYAKTAGSDLDSSTAYAFKVVPYNTFGEAPDSQVPTVTVSLESRTTHLSDDPRHTDFSLGSLFDNDALVRLDKGSVELSTVDLNIPGLGVDALLSRHYSSILTTATTFAPGWRFSFEQLLTVNGNIATYTDAVGDVHRFTLKTTPVASATGGTKSTLGSDTIHTFTGSGTFSVTGQITGARVLVVGGGGGGWWNLSGGGGGGGVIDTGGLTLSGTTAVTVGAGGAACSANGQNSSFGSTTAFGGGRGASRDYAAYTATAGGSGGGGAGAMPSTAANQYGAAGTSGQGYAGGNGIAPDLGADTAGGGGGGAGGTGGPGTYRTGGNGGAGKASDITGSTVYYGGGGGGCSYYAQGAGGIGGGGSGAGAAGTPNTGGGGGGGAAGGSGIVIVRYPTPGTTSSWISPTGFSGTLTQAGSDYKITLKDRSVLTFGSDGKLKSVADKNGNTVTYTWGASNLVIKAVGDSDTHQRRITVAFNANGKATSASAVTPDGTRSATYTYGTNQATVAVPGSTNVYRWGADTRLTSIEVPDYSDTVDAVWHFEWNTNALTLSNTSGSGTPACTRAFSWDLGARSGTMTYGSSAQTFTWNPTGTPNTASVFGATDKLWTYRYDACNYLCGTQSPTVRVTQSANDARGNALASTDVAGRVTTNTYDSHDQLLTSVDPRGSVKTFTYDGRGNLLSSEQLLDTAGNKARTEWTYDATNGRLNSVRSKVDASTWSEVAYTNYADCGRARTVTVKSVKLSFSGSTQDLVTTRDYNQWGNLLSQVDPAGANVTTNTYGSDARLATSTDASGTVTHYIYGPLGGITEAKRTNEATSSVADWTITSYNGAGLPTVTTSHATNGSVISTLTYGHDALGRLVQATSSLVPGAEVRHYNERGLLDQLWTAGSDTSDATAATRYTYNDEGELLEETDPGSTSAKTVNDYNSDGTLNTTTHPDETVKTYTYEPCGDIATLYLPTAGAMAYDTDLTGQVVKTEELDEGATMKSTYDLSGRLTKIQRSADSVEQAASTVDYNSLGWILKRADFDGITTLYTYDKDGRVVSQDVNGIVTTYAYDGLGRLIAQVNPDSSSLSYRYDVFGNRTLDKEYASTGALAKNLSATFDEIGRVKASSDPVTGEARQFTYASDGTVTVATSRRGGTVSASETMNGTGLLTGINTTVLGRSLDWSVETTDTANRVVESASVALSSDRAIRYDEAGRTVWQGNQASAPSQPVLPVGWDGTGAITYGTDNGKKSSESLTFSYPGRSEQNSYEYDKAGRLTSATIAGSTTTYSYDALSGSLSGYQRGGESPVSVTYDSSGRLSSIGDRHYTYDDLGRRIHEGSSANPNATAYTWSGMSLTGFSGPGGQASYTYDAAGQRIRSAVTSGTVTTTSNYDYDGSLLQGISASRSDGTTWTVDYVISDLGRPVAGVYAASGVAPVTFGIVTTERGDVRELIDSSGEAFAFYSYDAYGRPLETVTRATALVSADTAAAIASRQALRYAGYVYDAESGLYYCWNRYYDPQSMQFVSRDPVRADGEQSQYLYCSEDPVNGSDPDGLVMILIGDINGHASSADQALEASQHSTGALHDYYYRKGVELGTRQVTVNREAAQRSAYLPSILDMFISNPKSWSAFFATAPSMAEKISLTKIYLRSRVYDFANTRPEDAALGFCGAAPEKVGGELIGDLLAKKAGTTALAKYTQTTAIEKYSYWPKNSGALGSWSKTTLQEGTLVDRYGLSSGRYASPAGTPFSMRSLPKGVLSDGPFTYEVLQPVEVSESLAAPAFGQPGYGVQYKFDHSMEDLVNAGILAER